MIAKALLSIILIAFAETLHGIARVRWLNPRIGDRRSRRAGVATGTLLILLIGWFVVPWIAPRSWGDCVLVGAVWLGAMLSYDLVLARRVFHMRWRRIAADFNPLRGGMLGFGMLALFLTPGIVAYLRGLLP